MKKSIIAILALAFISGGLNSCKKGENDPFLSLKTRKARLAGEWELTSSKETSESIQSDGDENRTDINFDGTTRTQIRNSQNVSPSGDTTYFVDTLISNYTYKITFEKSGSYSLEITEITEGGPTNVTKESGFWNFQSDSETSDLKKKESIVLEYSDYSLSQYDDEGNLLYVSTHSEHEDYINEIFVLDRLSNKEMAIKQRSKTFDTADYQYESSTELNFKKK